MNEAVLRAVRNNQDIVTQEDLESIEVVIAGYRRAPCSPTRRRKWLPTMIGHALVAAGRSHSAPVQRITVIAPLPGPWATPCGWKPGTSTFMSERGDKNKIATFTGGRAAEEVVFGSITTGASNDIEQATKLARAMISRYGMKTEFDMVAMETVTKPVPGRRYFSGLFLRTLKRKIDRSRLWRAWSRKQHEKARDILLRTNRSKLDELDKLPLREGDHHRRRVHEYS
ncbi:MAG: hypothetical protein V8T45_07230 [Oscillospiraceae bacterium]